MTADPLTFLRAAHACAEKVARALPRGPWEWAHQWEGSRWLTLKGPDGQPVLRSHCDVEGARSWIELHPAFDEFLPDPEAVLRRIEREREAIDECETVLNGWYYDETKELATTTVRLLAEAWGWTEDNEPVDDNMRE